MKSKQQSGGGNSTLYMAIGGGAVVTAGIIVAVIMFSGQKKEVADKPSADDGKSRQAAVDPGKKKPVNPAIKNGSGSIASTKTRNETGRKTLPAGKTTPLVRTKPAGKTTPPVKNTPAGKTTPPIRKKPAGKTYPVVLSNPKISLVKRLWTIDVDYEFIIGAPKPDYWYTLSVSLPVGIALLAQLPGSALKQKGTMRVTGVVIFPRKASGTIKIELRQGREKNVSRVRLAAILETVYKAANLKVFKRYTADELVAQIAVGDKSLQGKLIRVKGSVDALIGFRALSLGISRGRLLICKLQDLPKRKFVKGESIEVEGFFVYSREKSILLVACRVVAGTGAADVRLYQAREIVSGNSAFIAKLLNKRIRVQGSVLIPMKNGWISLQGISGRRIACRFADEPRMPIAKGKQIIVEGVFSDSKLKYVKLTDCRLVTGKPATKTKSP